MSARGLTIVVLVFGLVAGYADALTLDSGKTLVRTVTKLADGVRSEERRVGKESTPPQRQARV